MPSRALLKFAEKSTLDLVLASRLMLGATRHAAVRRDFFFLCAFVSGNVVDGASPFF